MEGSPFISYSDVSKTYLIRSKGTPYIRVEEANVPYIQRTKLADYDNNANANANANANVNTRHRRGRKRRACPTIVEDPAENFDKLEGDEYNVTLEGYVLIY